jgi:hypothetical protein
MKPTSLAEAEKMTNIIKTFRIASSAKGAGSDLKAEGVDTDSTNDNAKETKEEQDKESKENTKLTTDQITSLFAGGNVAGSSNRTFSFGYPDMCKFQIVLQRSPNGADAGLSEVFASEFCVIENVQVDYGSQNKMVFFSNEIADSAGGKYYPSEVTLSIGLRETTLPLAGQIADGQSGNRTIF